MDFLSILSALVIFSPYTVSTGHLLCNENKCPKVNCFVGWQAKGYDASGRLYTTCRFYTDAGIKLKNIKESISDFLK
jgi:hypothetical protein